MVGSLLPGCSSFPRFEEEGLEQGETCWRCVAFISRGIVRSLLPTWADSTDTFQAVLLFSCVLSFCSQGDRCPFRHCEAALGSERVCRLWIQGCCFRNDCKFRHMKIEKQRSAVPCYWENQPGGCQKAHCRFLHLKERGGNGPTVPPSDEADTSLPLNSGPAESLENQTEVEEAAEGGDIPSSSHGPAAQKRKRCDEEEEDDKAEELPHKKRVKAGRKVRGRPIDWKTTFPTMRRRKRKAAEMQPSAAEDADEPPARKLPMAILASVLPEYTIVSVEVLKLPSSLELLPGSQADSVAPMEIPHLTTCATQEADQAQQLSCPEVGKEHFSEDEDLEKLLMEFTEEELDAEIDDDSLDTDELLMEL
ncbi:zinc finger CCCH domain-containing protein 11A-like isoform X1 [Lagopus muta]|uniref:zinc finger CCCH domain-containing protein 11A-like isoform X1 n=1 Tax=Lagopus muta TaxID=64668 RepID=UPI0020A0D1FF|nr:zinc finger CCCH domain-containing protein 11A-like isoform X1 [Lagopus muta]